MAEENTTNSNNKRVQIIEHEQSQPIENTLTQEQKSSLRNYVGKAKSWFMSNLQIVAIVVGLIILAMLIHFSGKVNLWSPSTNVGIEQLVNDFHERQNMLIMKTG